MKYLTDFLNTVQTVVRDVTKAKATSAKDAITQKKAEAATKQEEAEEEEDEESDYPKRLLQAFAKLKGAKDLAFQFLVCDTKPFPTLALAKRITPKHKQELMDMTEGSKRFLKVGSCMFQDGKFNFVMEEPIAGLARKLQASIKNLTGKKLPIVIGSETAEEEEEQSGTEGNRPLENATNPDLPQPRGGGLAISGSVGRGENLPQDVMAVQTALNNRMKAGLNVDGKCTPQTIAAIEAFQKNLGQFKPDGRVDPGRGSARALAGTGPLPPPPAAPAVPGRPLRVSGSRRGPSGQRSVHGHARGWSDRISAPTCTHRYAACRGSAGTNTRQAPSFRPPVSAPFGRRVRLSGRLTNADGQPIEGGSVEALERRSDGTVLPIGLVTTDRRGRFRYVLQASRNRDVLFRYGGSRRIGTSTATVHLRVRGSSSMAASQSQLRNGESVLFVGRVTTRPIPAAGKLLEIQAYFRGAGGHSRRLGQMSSGAGDFVTALALPSAA